MQTKTSTGRWKVKAYAVPVGAVAAVLVGLLEYRRLFLAAERVWAWCMVLTACALGALPQVSQAADFPDVVQRVKTSVVGVGTYLATRSPPGRFMGTGFVVGDGRLVLTNVHVIAGVAEDKSPNTALAVFTRDGVGGVRMATLVAEDSEHDLALLRISDRPLPALTLADSSHVREGEPYAFTGFPLGAILGLHPVTHEGIISAITPVVMPAPDSRHLKSEQVERLRTNYDVFQLDATAYPGSSGSPLYDPATGDVVGIISMVLIKETIENLIKDPSGISYAIPINFARALIERAEAAP